MSDFLQEVRRAFAELIAHGDVSVESSHCDDRAFGNAVVVLAGKGFWLHLQRDRGDTSADAASVSAPEEWVPLERVLDAIGVSGIRPEGLLTPAEAAHLVQANLREIEAGFSADRANQTLRKLEELRRLRLAETLKRFRRTSPQSGTET